MYLDCGSRSSISFLFHVSGSLLVADLQQSKVYCFKCVCERINLTAVVQIIITIIRPFIQSERSLAYNCNLVILSFDVFDSIAYISLSHAACLWMLLLQVELVLMCAFRDVYRIIEVYSPPKSGCFVSIVHLRSVS
jgi:hypothetical protein